MNALRHIFMGLISFILLAGCAEETISTKDAIEEIKMRSSSFESGQTGKGDPIYIFFDPQCGHCLKLWETTKKIKGKNFEWVPVGIFKGSTAFGARILSSENPSEEFEKIKNKNNLTERTPEYFYYDLVDGNTRLLKKLEAGGVPLIVWKKPNGEFEKIEGALDRQSLAILLK